MRKQIINPWTWQDGLGFSQGVLVEHAERTLYAAGQGPVDADGHLVAEGDVAGQVQATLANVATVLAAAGMGLGDVVRYELWTTDLQSYFVKGHEQVVAAFADAGVVPAGTATQVSALSLPGMEVELTVTACR